MILDHLLMLEKLNRSRKFSKSISVLKELLSNNDLFIRAENSFSSRLY